MRTYTTLAAGTAAKLLRTDLHHTPGSTTASAATGTVATVADPALAGVLAAHLTDLAAALLIDAANPDLPAALRTLGVRQAQVQPEPGNLTLAHLADRPGPDFRTGTSWRPTGIPAVWHLAHVLHHLDQLPAGPARSLRRELADLLATADGRIVTATVVADDFGDGYGTDEIAYAHEPLVGHLLGNGRTGRVDAAAWIRENRPHLVGQLPTSRPRTNGSPAADPRETTRLLRHWPDPPLEHRETQGSR